MKRILLLALSVAMVAACNRGPDTAAPAGTPADAATPSAWAVDPSASLTAETARRYAHDAYVFTYPLVLNYRTMYSQAIKGDAEFGKWLHLGLSSPADTDIVTPNNDTPYSYAWVDLRAEPWVMTLPEIEADRYYTAQWDDLWGYVLDNPGSVNDGNDGGSYLLAAPDWNGEVPAGIKRVIRGESSILGTLTRTQLLGGNDDLPRVKEIQGQYRLQPLSAFLGQPAPAAAPAIDWPAWTEGDENSDKYWEYVQRLLPLTARNEADSAEYDKLAALGIGAGKPFDFSALDPSIQEAIRQGVKDAQAEFAAAGNDPALDSAKLFGDRGRIGTDYRMRTLGVVLGIFGNVKEQAIYRQIPVDADGKPLDGSKASYTVTFPKGQTPPVDYFWSYTMYQLPSRLLVDNPIDRYSISNRAKGLKTNADGSLTLHFSSKSPGKDKESNWLPTPDGPFWMVLRNYGPHQDVIDGSYQAPPLVANKD